MRVWLIKDGQRKEYAASIRRWKRAGYSNKEIRIMLVNGGSIAYRYSF